MLITAQVSCPIQKSFRVHQVAGLFDVPLSERVSESFSVEVPGEDETWQIGLIVGPSGSGKSTIARQAFGDNLYQAIDWPVDLAVIDGFGDLPIKQVTALLTAVGFSSPPAWIKPYHVLSGGERFRCDLARALSQATNTRPDIEQPLIAFDEFTSVVDRNVARIGSAAVSKAIRGGLVNCRFVAVTCHYDVAEWLEPDWTVDMATGQCVRRRLRRPPIHLEVVRCRHAAWKLFARHHYLTGSLSKSARCYLAVWNGEPVALCAVIPLIGRRQHWRITRLVTLPDYQGVGIGMRVAEAVAAEYTDQGLRMNITSSHPALRAHCTRSQKWRTVRVLKTGSASAKTFIHNYRSSLGRAVVSFEYVG
jgi:GNAT superfamily N-acetyltransferase